MLRVWDTPQRPWCVAVPFVLPRLWRRGEPPGGSRMGLNETSVGSPRWGDVMHHGGSSDAGGYALAARELAGQDEADLRGPNAAHRADL